MALSKIPADLITGGLSVDPAAPADAITVDSSGNVGIGTSAPTFSAGGGLMIQNGTQANLKLDHYLNGGFEIQSVSSTLRFYSTAASAERARIDSSGNLLLGTTASNSGYGNNNAGMTLTASGPTVFSNSSSGDYGLVLNKTAPQSGSTYYQVNFRSANVSVGGIFTNASSTTYSTTSDHRLKENVVGVTGASARVQQLNPVRFNFIADADATVDGFLAHEVQDVVPEAITGTRDEVDAEGNPVYQGIDQSKLVPLLTAALQEALTKIETLEARVAALEGGV